MRTKKRGQNSNNLFHCLSPFFSLSMREREFDTPEHLLVGNQNNLAVLIADRGVINAVVLDGVSDERLSGVEIARVAGIRTELVDESDSHF